MGVDPFQERLKAGRERLRRDQQRRSWAFLAGLLATIVAMIASGSMFDIGVPDTIEQIAYVIWVSASWLGALSLFAFSLNPLPSGPLRNASFVGLWMGVGAVAASATVIPLGLILMLIPVGVGASIVGRIAGRLIAMVYLLLPVVAVFLSAIYQRYGAYA